MQKLRTCIEQYGRWAAYSMYIDRIETHIDLDFSLCAENAKALIEGISKQICQDKSVTVADDESIHKLVKMAFISIGFEAEDYINTIGRSLSAIVQQLGNLRNSVGSTSHGRTITELKNRNANMHILTREFLLVSVELICCFLIRNHENENPRLIRQAEQETLEYQEAEAFNDFWDDNYGEFEMGDYSYTASEILFNVDKKAYIAEYKNFIANESTE